MSITGRVIQGRLTLCFARLADVAGTKEPIYGPSAIRNVSEQAKTTPYTELKRDDMKWHAMNTTSVETFSFYLTSDNGHAALAQVIYSNVAYGISLHPSSPETPSRGGTGALLT